MPELVEYFIKQFAASMDKAIESIPQETMGSLVRHHWPATFESSKTTSRVASFSPMMHKGVEPMTVESQTCARGQCGRSSLRAQSQTPLKTCPSLFRFVVK
jgi:DNA-binding NtrC family response regulator